MQYCRSENFYPIKKFVVPILQRNLNTRNVFNVTALPHSHWKASSSPMTVILVPLLRTTLSWRFPDLFWQLSSHVSFSCPDLDLDLGARMLPDAMSNFHWCTEPPKINQCKNFGWKLSYLRFGTSHSQSFQFLARLCMYLASFPVGGEAWERDWCVPIFILLSYF